MPESGTDAQIPGGITSRIPAGEEAGDPPGDITLAAPGAPPLQLRRLELRHFRNIPALSLELTASRLLVVGANGAGKSNLLESVELLTSLRSHRSGHDRDLISHGMRSSSLTGWTDQGDRIALRLHRRGGRQALRNGRVLERQMDLPGSLRSVGFSALDLDLVRGEPARRRQWLDRVVMQLEPVYVDLLRHYGRLLRQRSHLLRQSPATERRPALLDVFDQQMALIGVRLHRRRHRALLRLAPLAAVWQERLGGGGERLTLRYRSGTILEGEDAEEPWRRSLEVQLRDQRNEEERLGQCLVGPHRDDVELLLSGTEARRYASAGQRRTLVLALKLAELDLARQVVGRPPLLLLDDVLAELDPGRQALLLEAVGEGHQCLVSATHLDAFRGGWRDRSQVVEMCSGAVRPF